MLGGGWDDVSSSLLVGWTEIVRISGCRAYLYGMMGEVCVGFDRDGVFSRGFWFLSCLRAVGQQYVRGKFI